MRERIKRRKEDGFTLIELMIVIAVIGILAVVLVPKMSSIKDSAKATGVITNAKSIEAYTIANIDKWVANGDDDDAILGHISDQFGDSGDDEITNPYEGGEGLSDDEGVGMVVVTVSGNEVTIKGYGNSDSDVVYNNTVKPY
ncbi:prepilin-type N-terminal cleavage/methylation domain-containing protein [Desulfosporosinus orientis DSM 765]|uniref:Prepilin-type N-terminal cleavage/methylation domain-containing protein n=1 Tax=Desulfosporosinus orientis (strain ATCC 19365 / DSM 765 / NCIMB 8382 / VKM B-1628 / Singapore I) TaxID=768706 RepID=G7W5L6_DESOD|nr:type II secretion system protein [Desulfosporosinus orientis]AET66663.1 prepilin-type N-terminal cleavage/methylation domain-containing protein [Desulfosporosinus orientis DSM 765]